MSRLRPSGGGVLGVSGAQLGTKGAVLSLGAALLLVFACAHRTSRPHAPSYEKPPLPPWEPQKVEEPAFDPAALEGEWVTDTPQSDSEDEKSLDLGAGGAQNSSTEDQDRATVRPPQSD